MIFFGAIKNFLQQHLFLLSIKQTIGYNITHLIVLKNRTVNLF
jgi:hypothetical protein